MTVARGVLPSSSKIPALTAALIGATLAYACGAERIIAFSDTTHRADVSVGDQVDITLRAAALGSYASPPAISTAAVVFVDVTTPNETPVPPGGPAQRFRFRAVAAGTAVVTFTPVQPGPAVVDTIVVR